MSEENEALEASKAYQSKVEDSMDYIERFDILETINNVGNDEVFTPVRTCQMILDILPDEVWHNPDYKWLNPCDKNGVFLREIAIRLDKGLKTVPGYEDDEVRRKHIMTKMLYSIGLTKFTALVSRRTNYYCSVANRKPDGDIDKDGHYKNGYSIGYGEWFDTEEGNILAPIGEHKFGRDRRCEYCRTAETGRYSDKTQNEHYAYEFIHVHHLGLQKHLQDRFFKGDRNMKFDIIIGNPPYQLSDGGGLAESSAKSIYNFFVDAARYLKPRYISFIIPSRWMAGGKGLDSFRDSMINDHHIKMLVDYFDAHECFPNNEIKGGVTYFLWDNNYDGKADITTHYNDGRTTKVTRYLSDSSSDVYIRDEVLLNVYNKVKKVTNIWFDTIVSPRPPYGIGSDALSKFDENDPNYPLFKNPFVNCLTLYGLIKGKREKRYIERESKLITDRSNNIDNFKVYLAKATGTGRLGEALSEPFIGEPQTICTETYLSIGKFDSRTEAENCISYIKTKFFRALLGLRKITQNGSQKSFSMIPLQDFSKPWTDKELYEKYNLSQDEIDYIEKYVEEMD